MNLTLEEIAVAAERLRLPHLAANASVIAEEAADKDLSYTEFLERLLKAEVAAADERATETLLRLSGLPYQRTLAEFDFKFQPSVQKKQLKELASCAFIERAENVVLLGPPGVGKTHLAVALGIEAVSRRMQVRFTTATDMVASLAKSMEAGAFTRRLNTYVKPSLLIIDEIGFLPLDGAQANLLFQVICRRYERGSIILTSNKSYGEWAEVFSGDSVIASAILDRLLHHSTTISIKGQSYRLKDKRRSGILPRSGKKES